MYNNEDVLKYLMIRICNLLQQLLFINTLQLVFLQAGLRCELRAPVDCFISFVFADVMEVRSILKVI